MNKKIGLKASHVTGQHAKLGINWTAHFLERQPELQSKYSRTLDQDRFFAEDAEIFRGWFDLYISIKIRYGILDADTYNMDEKGFMLGVAGSAKVVISKYEKQAFVNQVGNREWVTLIEGIGGLGDSLPLYVIFTPHHRFIFTTTRVSTVITAEQEDSRMMLLLM